MSIFKEVFKDVYVGSAVLTRWSKEDTKLLESASAKILKYDANPAVFVLDPAGFWELATDEDEQALNALTMKEHIALLGTWKASDFAMGLRELFDDDVE